MPTHSDISKLSISKLAWLARTTSATAATKLRDAHLEPVSQDGKTIYYDPRDALAILYGVGEGLNPAAEKARLDRARSEIAEHELAKKRGEVIPAEDGDRALVALSTVTSARLQSIGTATAPELAASTSVVECQRIVDSAVEDALGDLSSRAVAASEKERSNGAARDASGAETDGSRVGGG